MGSTLAEKIWKSHVVGEIEGRSLLYIDLHLVHDLVPQAFAGLGLRGLPLRRPGQTFATMDHSVPTTDHSKPIEDPQSAQLVDVLRANCKRYSVRLLDIADGQEQGIVHVVGPEQGLSQPGITIACGDSHTGTHGALGALAVGVGMSQVEQVLATQILLMTMPLQMAIDIDGALAPGVTAKDVSLAVIAATGFGGTAGHIVEFRGQTVRDLSIEGRLTLCNMSAEAGSRSSVIAPDETTYRYLHGRRYAPGDDQWDDAVRSWSALASDADAVFDRTLSLDVSALEPLVTWGTMPSMSAPISGRVPLPEETRNRAQTERALGYMGLRGGERIADIDVDRVFIGSCTNARIEDLRGAARVVSRLGRRVHSGVGAWVVPGSHPVKAAAEQEGLNRVFVDAGFEWREPGCSLCLAMNGDVLRPGERCASTSSRNFEGRQGPGSRTHLVSAEMAAAAAILGHFADVREIV
jgi:3-isopropylmalate/(R)-2-methylmalate dehydratase large subunit